MSDHGPDGHDLGLSHDLPAIVTRRRALGLLGATGLAAALAACGAGTSSDEGPPQPPSSGPGGPGGRPGGDSVEVGAGEIPEETNGPYPADGTNGVNVLTESGIVRSDIRSSFGTGSATAPGVPLTVTMQVVDVSSATDAGTTLAGAAVYVWQCDSQGRYSLHTDGLENENYLRGVQETDAHGTVTFTTVFPGAYAGRWPHLHFEVYPSLDDATSTQNRLRTSQLALPEDVCTTVYADASTYPGSARNLQQTPLTSDMVFGDGHSLQMATVTGGGEAALTASLRVPV